MHNLIYSIFNLENPTQTTAPSLQMQEQSIEIDVSSEGPPNPGQD